MKIDDFGPETVLLVSDAKTGMRGVLVVDNTVLGPAGGGTRMLPDLTVEEVMDLARGMTYKFGILGLPRGGSKAGIFADPRAMDAEKKQSVLAAFGRAVAPFLQKGLVAVGPDMGITVEDVAAIYAGAEIKNARSGLFSRIIDGDPAAYHFTGFGVVSSMRAALESAGLPLDGSTVAIEGFGQVGVGAARYAAKLGLKIVAITTMSGGIYEPRGLDVTRLLALRHQHGDDCVLHYGEAKPLDRNQIYYLPVDVIVPGARPYVIHAYNEARIQAKVVCPAANIAVTLEAEERFHQRGVLCLPDFVVNAGGALASWVDFLQGTPEQAFQVIDRKLGSITRELLDEVGRGQRTPSELAKSKVRERILASDGQRLSWESTSERIRVLLGL